MLTINNPRKGAHPQTGIVIGSFKLVDAGLSSKGDISSPLNNAYYAFHWNYKDEPRRFACYLQREPIMVKPPIYHIEIYDKKNNIDPQDSLFYNGSVSINNIKDRIGFLTWMTNQIVKWI